MPTALPPSVGPPAQPGHEGRREMATRQREAATAVRDSVERSALMLAAEVLGAGDEAEADDEGEDAPPSIAVCGSPP